VKKRKNLIFVKMHAKAGTGVQPTNIVEKIGKTLKKKKTGEGGTEGFKGGGGGNYQYKGETIKGDKAWEHIGKGKLEDEKMEKSKKNRGS